MNLLMIVKLVILFVAIWFSLINIARLIHRNSLPAFSIFVWGLSLTVFIIIQFELYS